MTFKPAEPSKPVLIAVDHRFKEIGDKKSNALKGFVRAISFKPGLRIERCGHIYEVDAKGTQRRVKK